SVGSTRAVLTPPGIKPYRSVRALMTASSAPAAPSAWPVAPFVELQGVVAPNRLVTAWLSERSLLGVPVPCKLMYSIDAGSRFADDKAACIARRAPCPCGCGAD